MNNHNLRQTLYEVIFGTETPAGKRFDILLIAAILLSVLALMLDSIEAISVHYGRALFAIEWAFTLMFTVEYVTRIYCAPDARRYVKSFYGIVDLISVLPSYLGLFIPGASYLLVVRLLRVLRIFRVFKLIRYLSEANILLRAILMSRRKIFVFFTVVLILSTVFGSLMYIVEGPGNGFSSIPTSIYWTIVTITTVGYGDIIPQTPFGQVIAAMAMLTGYSIIAVPTGILTAELSQEMQRERNARRCNACLRTGHDPDAAFCKFCGSVLPAATGQQQAD